MSASTQKANSKSSQFNPHDFQLRDHHRRSNWPSHPRNPPPHVSRPRSVPAMKPTAPCTVTLPAHQPHASHRHPLRAICRRPAEWCFESDHAAYATSRLSAHPAPTCGAMRESSRTTLVPRLPAPCYVATQGLPATARLCGSARCQPGCSLRLPSTARLRCWAAPTASVARGCPSGQRAKRPPSRPVRCAAMRCVGSPAR
jgi:hypothetical protein